MFKFPIKILMYFLFFLFVGGVSYVICLSSDKNCTKLYKVIRCFIVYANLVLKGPIKIAPMSVLCLFVTLSQYIQLGHACDYLGHLR